MFLVHTEASAHTEALSILSLCRAVAQEIPTGRWEEVRWSPSPSHFTPCSTHILIPYLCHLSSPIFFQEKNNKQSLPNLAVLPKTKAEELKLHTLATSPGNTTVLFSFSEHPAQEKACSGLWAIATVLLRSAQTRNSLIRALSLYSNGQASSGCEIMKSIFMIRSLIEKCTCNWDTASQHLYFLAVGKGEIFHTG